MCPSRKCITCSLGASLLPAQAPPAGGAWSAHIWLVLCSKRDVRNEPSAARPSRVSAHGRNLGMHVRPYQRCLSIPKVSVSTIVQHNEICPIVWGTAAMVQVGGKKGFQIDCSMRQGSKGYHVYVLADIRW